MSFLPRPRQRRPRAGLLAALLVPLALVAACGSGDTDLTQDSTGSVRATGAPNAQTANVDSTDELVFVPNEVDAAVGTLTLTLTNTGGVPHNLVFEEGSLPAIDTVTGGQSRTQTYVFSTAGTYDFVCTYHPEMVGKLVVSAPS